MNPKVDLFLEIGCMRCPLGNTPQCKVHNWQQELNLLRNLVLECNLVEEIKWGMPCYTYNSKNILMIAPFKHFCSLSFFKGVLLSDTHNILTQVGENTQSARIAKFTSLKQVKSLIPVLKAYIYEMIEIEKKGIQVNFKKPEEIQFTEELELAFANDPKFKQAFLALTPGRQRSYILSFNEPKQSKTKIERIEKYKEQILQGIGIHDKYIKNKK